MDTDDFPLVTDDILIGDLKTWAISQLEFIDADGMMALRKILSI